MKKIVVYSILLCSLFTKAGSQPLKQGDKLPSLSVTNVLNTEGEILHLDDYRGKLLILDFWGTGCIGCLQSFRRTDSLQEQFADKIQFVLVNQQSKDSTASFFRQRKKLYRPLVPMITGDTLLERLFPHQGDPFHVWIDQNGIVRSRSEGYNSNTLTIQEFLENGKVQTKQRPIIETKFNPFVDSIREGLILYYSILSKCLSRSIRPYTGALKDRTLHYPCTSVEALYRYAYGAGSDYFKRPGRVLFEVKDKSLYVFPEDGKKMDNWMKENCYSYEIAVANSEKDKAYDLMRQDLDRYLGLKGGVETRKQPCVVLERIAGPDRLVSKGGKPVDHFYIWNPHSTMADSLRYMVNQPLGNFYLKLQGSIEHLTGKPFLDETNYKGNIDIAISGNTMDNPSIPALNKELEKYGLRLIDAEREIQVLVIRDH